jgi:hypothetical protein
MLANLKAATFEVLETMYFLFPEIPFLAVPSWRGPGFRAWVPVRGPKTFSIGLTVPEPLARQMAANFLGRELPAISLSEMEDAVREGANMVAGNFLQREGASSAFGMQPPQSLRLDLGSPDFRLSSHHVLLMVDDHSLEVFLERG